MTMLSIVVPCFNEEACLGELHQRLAAAAKAAVGEDFELVLVNDGSSDGSWPLMRQLAQDDAHVIAVNLSRNHGHQLALTAGLDMCSGDIVLIIDADLQDPPELLSPMLGAMAAEEADVVYGVRRSRTGETAFKRATAHGFYRMLSRATDVDIPLDAGDFRLMSRRALNALLSMPEQARFIRGMVAWIGFRQVPFLYDRKERFAGESKYPLSKMIRFAFDALTGFSSAPLKLASHAGLALSGGSLLIVLYILYAWLSGRSIPGFDVCQALQECRDCLIGFGGHSYAAGLTIKTECLEMFRDKLCAVVSARVKPEDFIPKLSIDGPMDLGHLNEELVELLDRLAPFGIGNAEPLFVADDVELSLPPAVVSRNHLKLTIRRDGRDLDCIGFGMGHLAGAIHHNGGRLSVAFVPTINVWQNRARLQLKLRDIQVR